MSPMAKVLLVPQHDIIIPDFKRWYYSAHFFNVKPVKSYMRSLEVGMLQKVDLGIKFNLSRESHLNIEIGNHSPFPICLAGDIKFVEGNCTNSFEAAKRCGAGHNNQGSSGQFLSTVSESTNSATKDSANGSSAYCSPENGSSAYCSPENGSLSNGSSTNGSNCSCGNPCKLGRVLFQRLDLGDTLPEKATISFRFKFCPLDSLCIAAKDDVRSKIQRDGEFALKIDMAALRKNPSTADLTIICKDKHFMAHKIILSARSGVFATMFCHDDFKENSMSEVNITDCDKDIMEMFLKYVYEGVMGKTTFGAAEGLIDIATKYDVQPLVDACSDILAAHLNEGNAIRVVFLCSRYNLKELKNRALDVISGTKSQSGFKLVSAQTSSRKTATAARSSRAGSGVTRWNQMLRWGLPFNVQHMRMPAVSEEGETEMANIAVH